MPSRPAFRGKRPESLPLRPRARADWATQKTLVSFSPDNVHETGVWPGGQSGSPIVAAEEQVQRTRRKSWSRARSEVFVPHKLCTPYRLCVVNCATLCWHSVEICRAEALAEYPTWTATIRNRQNEAEFELATKEPPNECRYFVHLERVGDFWEERANWPRWANRRCRFPSKPKSLLAVKASGSTV
jgi:hypothetical protein